MPSVISLTSVSGEERSAKRTWEATIAGARGPQLLGDARRDRLRGDASRLGVADHAAHAAPELEAELGQLGGLARAGVAGEDHDLVLRDRRGDALARAGDRQFLGVI